jgi:hypothetical protein
LNRRVIYITSTAILVLEILAGAFMDLAHFPLVVQDVRSIGYPTYVLYIVGVWKILAVGALLWRRLPRLREWAYAGVFFEMSGAVASMFWSAISSANLPRRWLSPFSRWCLGGSSRTGKRPGFAGPAN